MHREYLAILMSFSGNELIQNCKFRSKLKNISPTILHEYEIIGCFTSTGKSLKENSDSPMLLSTCVRICALLDIGKPNKELLLRRFFRGEVRPLVATAKPNKTQSQLLAFASNSVPIRPCQSFGYFRRCSAIPGSGSASISWLPRRAYFNCQRTRPLEQIETLWLMQLDL